MSRTFKHSGTYYKMIRDKREKEEARKAELLRPRRWIDRVAAKEAEREDKA